MRQTWRPAVLGMVAALGADRRNAMMLSSPWPRAAGHPQHGAGMAHPAKPATEHGARTDPTATDVGGLDPAGVRAVGREGDTSPAERLAALGGGAGATDEALHGEESTTGTPVSVGAVLILLEQQRFRCALTGRSLTPDVAALDHEALSNKLGQIFRRIDLALAHNGHIMNDRHRWGKLMNQIPFWRVEHALDHVDLAMLQFPTDLRPGPQADIHVNF